MMINSRIRTNIKNYDKLLEELQYYLYKNNGYINSLNIESNSINNYFKNNTIICLEIIEYDGFRRVNSLYRIPETVFERISDNYSNNPNIFVTFTGIKGILNFLNNNYLNSKNYTYEYSGQDFKIDPFKEIIKEANNQNDQQ